MKNPFQYGNVVLQEAFCNRKQEVTDLVRAMKNGERLFVYSERRLGKTSLVQHALSTLPKRRFFAAYIDLLPTDGENSFALAMASALTESTGTTAKKILETAKQFFGRLAPTITTDDEGKPQVGFGIDRSRDPEPELEEVLQSPAKIATQSKKNVVVVFDEFQQILDYRSDRIERLLRAAIQHHQNVAYIFLGSRKHLIQEMFLDKNRPLYRAAGHYPLRSIEEKHWIPFIRDRFAQTGKQIDDANIREVCQMTEGHPFYTQHLSHALWELSSKSEPASEVLIQSAVRLLLDRESYAYTTLWESLANNQQRFLRGVAHEASGVKPFASAFTRKYGLRSASNAQRAVSGLLDRGVIDQENGTYVIVDRFFRLWIQQIFA